MADVEDRRQRWRQQTIKVEAVEIEAVEAQAAEAEGCIGGGGMHWKHQNVSEVHGGGQS
jgi:hypothetical protein